MCRYFNQLPKDLQESAFELSNEAVWPAKDALRVIDFLTEHDLAVLDGDVFLPLGADGILVTDYNLGLHKYPSKREDEAWSDCVGRANDIAKANVTTVEQKASESALKVAQTRWEDARLHFGLRELNDGVFLDKLPRELQQSALRCGKEIAWPAVEANSVIDYLTEHEIAIRGGRVWLATEPAPEQFFFALGTEKTPFQGEGEKWQDFVARANETVKKNIASEEWVTEKRMLNKTHARSAELQGVKHHFCLTEMDEEEYKTFKTEDKE